MCKQAIAFAASNTGLSPSVTSFGVASAVVAVPIAEAESRLSVVTAAQSAPTAAASQNPRSDPSLPPADTPADHQPRGAPAHGGLLAILPAPPADPARPVVGCGFCGREGDDARLLLTCSGCKWMRYCSAKHQRQHWYSNNKAYLLVISYFSI